MCLRHRNSCLCVYKCVLFTLCVILKKAKKKRHHYSIGNGMSFSKREVKTSLTTQQGDKKRQEAVLSPFLIFSGRDVYITTTQDHRCRMSCRTSGRTASDKNERVQSTSKQHLNNLKTPCKEECQEGIEERFRYTHFIHIPPSGECLRSRRKTESIKW